MSGEIISWVAPGTHLLVTIVVEKYSVKISSIGKHTEVLCYTLTLNKGVSYNDKKLF